MRRIYGYELKRMGISWLYGILVALIGVVAVKTVDNTVLYGVYDTAPYSQWSYITYLSKLMALTLALPVYQIVQMYSKHEQQVRMVTGATPVKGSAYMGIKVAALFTLYVLPVIAAVAYVFAQYGGFSAIERVPYLELVGLTAVYCLPQAAFSFGAGMWLGRISQAAGYGFIGALVFCNFIDLRMPMLIDLLGTSILGVGEAGTLTRGVIPFHLPGAYILSRLGFLAVGALLVFLACRREDQRA